MRQVNKVAAKIQNRFKGMMVHPEKNKQQAEQERYHSGQLCGVPDYSSRIHFGGVVA